MRDTGSILRHPLVLSFYLPSLILSVSWGLLVPVLPLYAKELDSSYAVIGLILAGESIGMLLGDLPAGMLTRRLGLKQTMLVGAGCAALSTAALFWANSVPLAVALRCAAGFGRALFGVARHAYVADAASTGIRGRAIALFGGLMRVGRFLGPLAGGLIAANQSLRATFLWFGVTNLAALLVMAAFVRVSAREGDQATTRRAETGLLIMLRAKGRVLAAAGTGQILAQMIRAGRAAIIPLYAADVLGLDVQAIGLIVSLSSAIDMSLFYPAGWLMDHWGRKWAIVPSFAVQAVGMFLVPFTASFAGLLAAASLIGLGNGIGAGTMMTMGADLAPDRAKGEFLGVWRLIGDGGHTGGPIVVGQVAEMVALPTAAWALAAAGLCAALVFGLLVPEPLKQRDPKLTPSS